MKKFTSHEIQAHLQQLNQSASSDWSVNNNILKKDFKFADFAKAFEFMQLIAVAAEELDHHPDWCNSYNKVAISLTTHQINGLTELDFKLAHLIERFLLQIS